MLPLAQFIKQNAYALHSVLASGHARTFVGSADRDADWRNTQLRYTNASLRSKAKDVSVRPRLYVTRPH
jgi:hypothetical protein